VHHKVTLRWPNLTGFSGLAFAHVVHHHLPQAVALFLLYRRGRGFLEERRPRPHSIGLRDWGDGTLLRAGGRQNAEARATPTRNRLESQIAAYPEARAQRWKRSVGGHLESRQLSTGRCIACHEDHANARNENGLAPVVATSTLVVGAAPTEKLVLLALLGCAGG